MHCFSSRVTSWLTWTLRVGGFVLRRRIGASVIRPSHLGWPTQHQRRSQEAVAVLGSQTIPWDRHRQIERKFCTIAGGVLTDPCPVPVSPTLTAPLAADEFIRRFLLHVLPKGFHRIRHYGLLASGTRKASLARARKLLAAPAPADAPEPAPPADRRLLCPCCGGRMIGIESFVGGGPAR